MQDQSEQNAVDKHNQTVIRDWLENYNWDGILLGNIDLLGVGLLHWLLTHKLPVLHHIGFVHSPYAVEQQPNVENYHLLTASHAVKAKMIEEGIRANDASIVYPGARTKLYGPAAICRTLPEPPCRLKRQPLHLCFAGLLMESKAPHTLLEAVAQLHKQGYPIRASLAGGPFQKSYVEKMKSFCTHNNIDTLITFYKQLYEVNFRFFCLIMLPFFRPCTKAGIVAEAMASGLALLSSGVGGASEVFENNKSGLQFEPGNAQDLSVQIKRLFDEPGLLKALQENGLYRARKLFDVQRSAKHLEELLHKTNHCKYSSDIQQF